MKILVVSLFRIGDLLLHNELIKRVHKKYPNSEIHVLANDLCEGVRDCLPLISKWHFFPRSYVQDILVKRIHRIEKAELTIQETIKKLNQEKFDLILNATHSRLSVLLINLLEAKEKRGNQFGRSLDMSKISNRWSLYLNEILATKKDVPFQLIDALCASLEFSDNCSSRSSRNLKIDRDGICLQLTTSDEKKNWPIEKWINLIEKIQIIYPNKELKILCAPKEKERLEKILCDLNVKIKSENLYKTKEILAEAELLITGDTSIQHLAAQVSCPIISLFLGSADLTKTAPYAENCYILKSKQTCHPCWHSQKCTRDFHLCSEDIKVNDVMGVINLAFNNHNIPNMSFNTDLIKTSFKNGKLSLEYINNSQKGLEASFERNVWSLILKEDGVSSEILKTYLDPAIVRLESVYQEIVKTQGFTSETEKIMVLIELLKEQKRNENSSYTISETR